MNYTSLWVTLLINGVKKAVVDLYIVTHKLGFVNSILLTSAFTKAFIGRHKAVDATWAPLLSHFWLHRKKQKIFIIYKKFGGLRKCNVLTESHTEVPALALPDKRTVRINARSAL